MSILDEIKKAALEAGGIIKSADLEHRGTVSKEGHANFATRYDRQVQEFLFERLGGIVPEAHFVGEEEDEGTFRENFYSGYTFIIDPIDGTSNFMKRYHPCVTSIALLRDGEPYIGVVYCPGTDQMFWAEKDCGAFLNEQQIHTSEDPLSESLVGMGTAPYYEFEVSRNAFDLGHWYMLHSIDVRRSGSAAYDVCMVASGKTGLFFEPRVYHWDYAGAACILLEAGGQLMDLRGNPLTFDRATSIVAVSGAIARQGREAFLPPVEMIHPKI